MGPVAVTQDGHLQVKSPEFPSEVVSENGVGSNDDLLIC